MTAADGHLSPRCAYERHPASIERHAPAGSSPAPGFHGITTWSPYLLGGQDGLERAAEPAPAAPARQDPPAGILPPAASAEWAETDEGRGLDPLPMAEPHPAEPADPAAVPGLPSPRDPFTILKAAAPPGLVRDAPLAWPGSSHLRRPSLPDETATSLWDRGSRAIFGQKRPRPALRNRLVIGLAGACLAGLVMAGLLYGPALLGSGQAVTAVFNAPMMVIRSAATGRVVAVAAAATQIVDPKSPLLTIHADDGSADRPVLAGVHGMVRSVETVPGAALVAGAPLVRLQDCDRAFLTIPSGSKLQAGQTVQVELPDHKPFAGRIRASAGIMEPPDSLVVGLDPGVVTASCPVGRTATVTPLPPQPS